MASLSCRKIELALIQMAVGSVKRENLQRAAVRIKEAASKGASLIALPECFNSLYGTEYFNEYAENIPGESTDFLSNVARDNSVCLIGGSIPERDGSNIYNTCTVWDPEGNLIAKHRKVHLFDVNVPGGIVFRESKVLSSGSGFTTFEHQGAKVGLGICYDMRFPEMALIYGKMGCSLLVYPGAFNMTTGPAHWELLQRARAADNQVYVATVAPARNTSASYTSWGHSSLVDPWGKVVATTEEAETTVYGQVDLSYIEKVRDMIPVSKQKRYDIYQVNEGSQK